MPADAQPAVVSSAEYGVHAPGTPAPDAQNHVIDPPPRGKETGTVARVVVAPVTTCSSVNVASPTKGPSVPSCRTKQLLSAPQTAIVSR